MEGEWVSSLNSPLHSWRRKEETTSHFPLSLAAEKMVIIPDPSFPKTEMTSAESNSVSLHASPAPYSFLWQFFILAQKPL